MIHTALLQPGPVAIRYPRGKGLGVKLDPDYRAIPIGKAEPLTGGRDVLIIALGSMVACAMEAAAQLKAEGCSAGVVNCRFVKPMDADLAGLAASTGKVVVVEENARQGGMGSAFLELLGDEGLVGVRVKRIGLPDHFVEHGPIGVLREKYGLDAAGIVRAVRELVGEGRRLEEEGRNRQAKAR
jgi:1-deoxy-D-xylulose-5-phosphate synthase